MMSDAIERLALPDDAVRGPNCGLTAIAIAARVSLSEATRAYQWAHAMLNGGKTKRGNWKGGTNVPTRRAALDYLGVNFTDFPLPRRMTLRTFARLGKVRAFPGRLYVVTTTGHVQVFRDGYVTDQRGTVPIGQYRQAGKMVKEVLIIEEPTT